MVFLACRAFFLTLFVNAGLYEQQTISSLLTTVDPELIYFLWSFGVYIFWQRNLTKGKALLEAPPRLLYTRARCPLTRVVDLEMEHEFMRVCFFPCCCIGKLFSVQAVDTKKTVEQLYDSSLFGASMFVQPSIAHCQRVICLAVVFLATRRLVQSIMVFYFELGFMANMNGQVVKYLTKYAALRKLNTRWCVWAPPHPLLPSLSSKRSCGDRHLYIPRL